jgi:hypothetical protein
MIKGQVIAAGQLVEVVAMDSVNHSKPIGVGGVVEHLGAIGRFDPNQRSRVQHQKLRDKIQGKR